MLSARQERRLTSPRVAVVHLAGRVSRGVILSVALGAALGVALTGCTGASPEPSRTATPPPSTAPTVSPSGDGTLLIGTLFPMTGPLAASGAAQVAGSELAAREISAREISAGNTASGPALLVELIHRDAAAAPDAALADLVARKVDVVLWDATSAPPASLAASVAEAGAVVLDLAHFANGGTPLAVRDEFAVRLRAADPGLAATGGAAEAFDAVMLTALAARSAGDDGGPSIAAQWGDVSDGSADCASWGECLVALDAGQTIAFRGETGVIASFTP